MRTGKLELFFTFMCGLTTPECGKDRNYQRCLPKSAFLSLVSSKQLFYFVAVLTRRNSNYPKIRCLVDRELSFSCLIRDKEY